MMGGEAEHQLRPRYIMLPIFHLADLPRPALGSDVSAWGVGGRLNAKVCCGSLSTGWAIRVHVRLPGVRPNGLELETLLPQTEDRG